MWRGGCAGKGSTVSSGGSSRSGQSRQSACHGRARCEVIWLEQGAVLPYPVGTMGPGHRRGPGLGCGQICFHSSCDIKAHGPVGAYCLPLPSPGQEDKGQCGSRVPHWRSWPSPPAGEALLGEIFALCFQMDHKEQDILDVEKHSPHKDQPMRSLTDHWSRLLSQSQGM